MSAQIMTQLGTIAGGHHMTGMLAMLEIALTAPTVRGQQVETGASQVYSCRAETVLRLNGIPATDVRPNLASETGSAIHERYERRLLAAYPHLLVEQSFTYRGVKATVDIIDPERRTLTDLKTKANRRAIEKRCQDGPEDRELAQVHLGAAAAIDAGIPVDTVELCYLPRDGAFVDAYVWSGAFSRHIADAAVDWVHKTNTLAAEWTEGDGLGGLRDESVPFCRAYCPYVTYCRGPEAELDATIGEVALEYRLAQDTRDAAEADIRTLRAVLEGHNGTWQGVRVLTVGGREKIVDVEDLDALRAHWRFVVGEPLPTRSVERVTPVQVRVTRVKP